MPNAEAGVDHRKIVATVPAVGIVGTVNKSTRVVVAGVFALALALALYVWRSRSDATATSATGSSSTSSAPLTHASRSGAPESRARPSPATPQLTSAEKAARTEKIKRDYDEIRAKASADYSAAGKTFPGGLNAFLRELALLEREKRADLAAILSSRELEDYEMRETSAGQVVQRLLGETAAIDEQRRAVFRLQREFEDRFALTFDVTPQALLERETARQQTQERIRGVLGDELFGAWLRGEGEDFARFSSFSNRYGLAPTAALDLWRAKNDFVRERLALGVKPATTAEQQRNAQTALTKATESRVMSIVGPGAWQPARDEILGWLPRK